MKFHAFHFLPYADVDFDFRDKGQKTLWMFHKHRFDPETCADYYERYFDELELAGTLGYDGVCVNEHHQTPHSLMPAPNIIAAALSQRVKRGRISILGRALPLVPNPLSVAEEWAMLDNMTRGRLNVGMVRGIGVEYHASNINPVESNDRYIEAHDLIVKSWVEEGAMTFQGKYYENRHFAIFPRTYQQPHPPIWIPSGGNRGTIDWAAHPDRRYTYLQFFNNTYEAVRANLGLYKEIAREKYGYTAQPGQLGWAVPTYVARTDEEAIDLARPHLEALFNDFMAMTPELLFPPGYVPAEAMVQIMKNKPLGGRSGGRTTIEQIMAGGMVHIGSPETIRAKIRQARDEIGLGELLPMLHFTTMSAPQTRENIEMYAAEVMEPLRAEFVATPETVTGR